MSNLISETEKNVLYEAVESRDPVLIAKCVVTIEEIYQVIKHIISQDRHDGIGIGNEVDNNGQMEHLISSCDQTQTTENDQAEDMETEVKEEPEDPDENYDESGTRSNINQFTELSSPAKIENYRRPCCVCNFTTLFPERLEEHIISSHVIDLSYKIGEVSSVLLKCSLCEYQTETIGDIIEHVTANHNNNKPEEQINCKYEGCMFVADNKTAISRHMTSEHPEFSELLQCPDCSFSTTKKVNYRQHRRTHLAPEDKPYKCEVADCSYSSANKEGLKIHTNSAHKGIKPFLCDTCGQSFTGISMLSKHKLMKHKPKHLQCPHCDYKTSLQNWLKDHMKKHSAETPYTCTHCSYAAKKPGRLKVHMRIHTGERPYKCHKCDYGAMEGAPLKKHLKNQHSIIVQRIDIREGKLYLADGSIIETGLSTKTAPLPAGSYPTSDRSTQLQYTQDGESVGTADAGHNSNKSNLHRARVTSGHGAMSIENIIAKAASLSALPVTTDEQTTDSYLEDDSNTDNNDLSNGFKGFIPPDN